MKKLIVVTALFAAAVFAVVTAAKAEVPVAKIAVVDLKRCLADSAKGKKLKEEFESKTAKTEQKMQALDKEGRELLGELERQQALLSDAVKKEKQNRILSIRDEMKGLDRQKREINDELAAVVIRDVQGIVKNLAQIRGYTMVINDGGPWLLYSAASVDVTNEVISMYDQASGK